jgi:phage gpG-like protein
MLIEFEVFGEKQVSRELLRFSQRAIDAAPAFELIADDMRDINEAQFESEGARGSGGWAPLAASTVAYKAMEGLDPRILHATLALRNSLTQKDDSNAQWLIDPLGIFFRSDVEYGAFHQSGTSKMPQRRPVEFTEVDRQHFVTQLQRYIVHGELA